MATHGLWGRYPKLAGGRPIATVTRADVEPMLGEERFLRWVQAMWRTRSLAKVGTGITQEMLLRVVGTGMELPMPLSQRTAVDADDDMDDDAAGSPLQGFAGQAHFVREPRRHFSWTRLPGEGEDEEEVEDEEEEEN
eukprot:gene7164-2212_t